MSCNETIDYHNYMCSHVWWYYITNMGHYCHPHTRIELWRKKNRQLDLLVFICKWIFITSHLDIDSIVKHIDTTIMRHESRTINTRNICMFQWKDRTTVWQCLYKGRALLVIDGCVYMYIYGHVWYYVYRIGYLMWCWKALWLLQCTFIW